MADPVDGGESGQAEGEMADRLGVVAHCSVCREERLFVRARIRHARHLSAAVLTGGLWLVAWLALIIERALRPWRCGECGWHKPEFRRPLWEPLHTGGPAQRGGQGCEEPEGSKVLQHRQRGAIP